MTLLSCESRCVVYKIALQLISIPPLANSCPRWWMSLCASGQQVRMTQIWFWAYNRRSHSESTFQPKKKLLLKWLKTMEVFRSRVSSRISSACRLYCRYVSAGSSEPRFGHSGISTFMNHTKSYSAFVASALTSSSPPPPRAFRPYISSRAFSAHVSESHARNEWNRISKACIQPLLHYSHQ